MVQTKPTQDDIDNDKANLSFNATLNDVLVSYDLIDENVKSPILSKDTKRILAKGGSFWVSMRSYLGANYGIGHIRHKGVSIQSLNEYAHKGLSGLYAACEAGVVIQGKLDKYSDYTWDTTVPVVGSSYVDVNNVCVGLTEFWKQANCWSTTPQGWVKIVVSGYNTDLSSIVVSKYNSVEYTYNDVKNQMDAYNKGYLYTYAYALGSSGRYVPSYAIATA